MKIFEFKWPGGEKDWMFSYDMEEAKETHLSITGCGDHDDCSITAIPESRWSECYILDISIYEDPESDDYNEDDYCNGYKIEMTFAEYAAQNTVADMIATTNLF